MNTNKKNQAAEKKHNITFIDIVVLIVVVCIVVVSALNISSNLFKWQQQTEATSLEKPLLYSVEFKALTKEQIDQIKLNDDVYFLIDGDKGNLSGQVVDVKIKIHSEWKPSSDGASMVLVEDSQLNDVLVTIEFKCIYSIGSGYFFDGNQLLVGEKKEFQFSSIATSGECVAMTVKE